MMSRRHAGEVMNPMESMSLPQNVADMCPVPRSVQAVNGSPTHLARVCDGSVI